MSIHWNDPAQAHTISTDFAIKNSVMHLEMSNLEAILGSVSEIWAIVSTNLVRCPIQVKMLGGPQLTGPPSKKVFAIEVTKPNDFSDDEIYLISPYLLFTDYKTAMRGAAALIEAQIERARANVKNLEMDAAKVYEMIKTADKKDSRVRDTQTDRGAPAGA